MDYFLLLASLCVIYSIATLGQNYATGYAGLISLNHGAFFGIGAYAGAVFLTQFQTSFFLALLAAAICSGTFAFLISFPLLRLKGDSFVLVSFGISFIVYEFLLNSRSITNGPLGIKGIPSPETLIPFPGGFFLLTLLVLCSVLYAMHRILCSAYGIIIRSTRENARVTQIAGHSIISYQRSVYVLSAIITGVAGVFLAVLLSTLVPPEFNYYRSVLLLVMAIFGGLASLGGSVLGAGLMVLFPELLRFSGFPNSILAESVQIVYGLLLVFLMISRPRGLFGRWNF